jgi:hypothetical protein
MRPIKRAISIAGVFLGLSMVATTGAVAEPATAPVPQAQEKSRYEALVAHSPFALATVPAPAPVAQASFAANWFVTGIGRIGGEDFVSIKSRDLATQFSLYAGENKKADEVALVSVTWSDVVGKSTVILRKGTETAKLEFNEAEVHATPKGPAGSPVAANAAPGAPRPPGVGGQIGAPPIQAMVRPPQAPTAMAAMPVPRRRVAPIRPPQ